VRSYYRSFTMFKSAPFPVTCGFLFCIGSDRIGKKKSRHGTWHRPHTLEKPTVRQHIIAKSEQIERKSANPVRAGDPFSYHNSVGICSFAESRMAPQGASFLWWNFVPIWSPTLEASFASGKKNSSVKLLSWCFLAIRTLNEMLGRFSICAYETVHMW
jgi:hypothetical protein